MLSQFRPSVSSVASSLPRTYSTMKASLLQMLALPLLAAAGGPIHIMNCHTRQDKCIQGKRPRAWLWYMDSL